MDKNEYRAKLEEINELVDRQDYKGALRIVDTIDWRRVRSARTLCMVGEIYEANKRYEESRKLLLLAHQRAPIGRTVLYRLVELSIKMGNLEDAVDYYKQFVEVSPNDNSRYILKYKIYKANRSSIEEQISILQEYKAKEYTERWAYELARLYAKAGMKDACVEECDDLILWFSEGRYVTKAMELKMKYTSLTSSQQEKYDKRFVNKPSVTAAAAAGAVTAAAEAAAKIVGGQKNEIPQNMPLKGSDSGDQELEALLNTIAAKDQEAKASVFAPAPENETDFQEKAAQNLRDVLSMVQPEAAAAKAPEIAKTASEEKEYLVKELEPDDLTKTTEFKPFRLEKSMTMEVKAEAPRSESLEPGEDAEKAFQSDISPQNLDLEALFEETANELAHALSQEETASETEENVSGLVAPAAARAAIVAAGVAEAVAAKAEEIDALRAEAETQEVPEEDTAAAEEVPEEDTAAAEEVPEEHAEAVEEAPEEDLQQTREFQIEEIQEEEISEGPQIKYTAAAEEEHPEAVPGNGMEGVVRHYLTEEEQRRLFTYFAPIPGMSQQIHEVLDTAQESACAKTSQAGNIIITGRQGSGKTRLSEGLIKAICMERQMEGTKVAYLDAEKLNGKDPVTVVGKLSGGFLVVEHAASLNPETVDALSKAMEFKTNRLTVILEELRQGIESLEAQYPDFIRKFDSRIVIPVFTNDELVSFAKTYAKELGYKIDDMAVLALYTLIGDNQDEEKPMTIGSVREMMDDAIRKASKRGRRPGKRVGKRHLDDSGRILLYEKDFDV